GPIATNSAVFVGFKAGGMLGATVAAIAVSLPSLMLVIILSIFMYKMQNATIMDDVYYRLRPVITGLIAYVAINFAMQNNIINLEQLQLDWIGLLFVLGGIGLIVFTRINPAMVILLSGIMGIVVYY